MMFMKGKLVELMVHIAPQIYHQYITTNNESEKILYMRVQKALYGMLKSALLFYQIFKGDLEAMGFQATTMICMWITR